jgi:hypothetical protein
MPGILSAIASLFVAHSLRISITTKNDIRSALSLAKIKFRLSFHL